MSQHIPVTIWGWLRWILCAPFMLLWSKTSTLFKIVMLGLFFVVLGFVIGVMK